MSAVGCQIGNDIYRVEDWRHGVQSIQLVHIRVITRTLVALFFFLTTAPIQIASYQYLYKMQLATNESHAFWYMHRSIEIDVNHATIYLGLLF